MVILLFYVLVKSVLRVPRRGIRQRQEKKTDGVQNNNAKQCGEESSESFVQLSYISYVNQAAIMLSTH